MSLVFFLLAFLRVALLLLLLRVRLREKIKMLRAFRRLLSPLLLTTCLHSASPCALSVSACFLLTEMPVSLNALALCAVSHISHLFLTPTDCSFRAFFFIAYFS